MRTGSVRRQCGFTYLLLLAAMAIVAAVSAATLSLGSRMERAEAQLDLAWCERQYAHAVASYAAATPGVAHGPRNIGELESDRRRPAEVRHLRRAYADPVTGANDWRVFRDQGGWIVAVCRPLESLIPPQDGAQREPGDPCLPFVATP